jgi:hypothetical protein
MGRLTITVLAVAMAIAVPGVASAGSTANFGVTNWTGNPPGTAPKIFEIERGQATRRGVTVKNYSQGPIVLRVKLVYKHANYPYVPETWATFGGEKLIEVPLEPQTSQLCLFDLAVPADAPLSGYLLMVQVQEITPSEECGGVCFGAAVGVVWKFTVVKPPPPPITNKFLYSAMRCMKYFGESATERCKLGILGHFGMDPEDEVLRACLAETDWNYLMLCVPFADALGRRPTLADGRGAVPFVTAAL